MSDTAAAEPTTEPAADAGPDLATPEGRLAEAARVLEADDDAAPAEAPVEAASEPDEAAPPEDATEAEAAEKAPPRRREVVPDRELAAEHVRLRQLRRQSAKLEADLAAREQATATRARDAEEIAAMLRDNPIAAAERLAKNAGMTGAQFLERLQHRYLSDNKPTEIESRDELRAVRAELKAMREERASEQRQVETQRAHEAATREQGQWTEHLAGVVKGGRWANLERLGTVNGGELSTMLSDAVRYVYEQTDGVHFEELLDVLDEQEASRYARYRPSVERASAQPTRTPPPAASRDQVPAPNGQKPTAKARALTNADAAITASGRRNLTAEERLLEADRLLADAMRL